VKVNSPQKRLDSFWGEVDKKHARIIQQLMKGKRALDVGCGYGSTVAEISRGRVDCVGIDTDEMSIRVAKERFPLLNYLVCGAESLPFEDGYFDVIILRDALHHVFRESDFERVMKEIARVSKSDAQIIFFDPNVNFLLRAMRRISFHRDAECDYETAVKILGVYNYKIVHSSFNTIFSLPLSGGYVGVNFVPNSKVIYAVLLYTEGILERVITWMGIGRYLCLRYVLVGTKYGSE